MLKCQTLLVTGEWKGQPPSQTVDQETQSPVWLPKLEKGVHEDAGEAPSWCSAEPSRVWFGLSCSLMVWSGLAWPGLVWSVLAWPCLPSLFWPVLEWSGLLSFSLAWSSLAAGAEG